MNRCNWFVFACFVVLITPFVGCGDGRPQRVPVSGKVLVDNVPLTCGYIRFVPTGSRASGGKIESDGRFTLMCYEANDGAVVGKHQVEVTGSENLSRTKTKWHAPRKYSDFRTSELTYDVKEPTDDAVINLTWAGGAPFVEVDADVQGPGK